MIRSLYVDNFKALNDFHIQFTPFTVLIGDNSSGKTTVLQAIAFLKYCCLSDVKTFLNERGLPEDELCSKLSTKKNITFSATLDLHGESIVWDISFARQKGGFVLRHEKLASHGKTLLMYNMYKSIGPSYRLNAETGERDAIMDGSFNNSILRFTDVARQRSVYPELVAIRQFFGNIETMDLLSPVNMKKSSKGEADSIGTGGEKLSSFIKALSTTERNKLAKDIRHFMQSFSSVIPKTKQYGWVHLETKEAFAEKVVDVSAANVSDGIMRIIAMCALRYLKSESSAILLDEIEDGVNNEHFEALVNLLKTVAEEKKTQIIATTHNTTLLDYWIDKIDPEVEEQAISQMTESIICLSRSPLGAVDAKNLLASMDIRERLSYMYPGEVVQSMTNHELREALNEEHNS